MKKMNPVVHFEMPAEDLSRMKKFYEDTFGWEMNQLGKEMGDYVVVTTAESEASDLARRPKEPGSINGGFYKKTNDALGSQAPHVVIAVDDINEATRKVKEAGGQVIGGQHKNGEPDDIPGVGLYSSIIDTEGNAVGILQPKM